MAKENDPILFEKVTIDASNFFKEIKDYRHAQKYSLLLGNHYQDLNKYKNAARYFAYSNENMFKKQKIFFWEDL